MSISREVEVTFRRPRCRKSKYLYDIVFFLTLLFFMPFLPTAPRVHQLEGNMCEITWETIPPMRGDPVSYVLQVLVGRESEYKQVRPAQTHTHKHGSFEDSVESSHVSAAPLQ